MLTRVQRKVRLDWSVPRLSQHQHAAGNRHGRGVKTILTARTKYVLAASGLPKCFWRGLMFTPTVWTTQRCTPRVACSNHSRYRTAPSLTTPSLTSVIFKSSAPGPFAHIETHTKKLNFKEVEGHLVGYRKHVKSYPGI